MVLSKKREKIEDEAATLFTDSSSLVLEKQKSERAAKKIFI